MLIGESDQWHHKPLYTEIVQPRPRCRPGRSVGVPRSRRVRRASNHIHSSRILSLSEDLPLAVVDVGAEERIRAFVAQLDELVSEGLVIFEKVEVVRCVGRSAAGCRS